MISGFKKPGVLCSRTLYVNCKKKFTLSQSHSLMSMSSEADSRYGSDGCTARLLEDTQCDYNLNQLVYLRLSQHCIFAIGVIQCLEHGILSTLQDLPGGRLQLLSTIKVCAAMNKNSGVQTTHEA